ncbi:MAG: AAA family ATPase [Candidatus Promineifilaceae bacterium]
MKIRIWGARGSIPTPISPTSVRDKIINALRGAEGVDLSDPIMVRAYVDSLSPIERGTVGGNTACVEITAGEDVIIVDAGSGLRLLGQELMKGAAGQGKATIHLFLSHTHWDHIQGLPFFLPAYIPGNYLNIYHIHESVPATLVEQMKSTTFPVTLDYMKATFQFIQLMPGKSLSLGDLNVTTVELPHPGRAYAFRFEYQGAVLVYASDAEYKRLDDIHLQPYLNFFAGADVLIFDAQFSLRESFLKEDWGHSSALIGADMAGRAGVKRLVLFHHDPSNSDPELEKILKKTIDYLSEQEKETKLEVLLGYEGLEINLTPGNACSLQRLPDRQVAILRLIGEIDERVVADLQSQLDEFTTIEADLRPTLIVDLEATTRLSIAGLRTLINLHQDWGNEGPVLAGPSAHVQKIIDLADYSDFFAIYPNLPAALSAFDARQALHLPGQLLKGRYKIESRVAKSEIGTVLKATDTRLDRPVIIKVFSPAFSRQALERFRTEAQRMAQLNAPNVAAVFDYNEEKGLAYLVTEYVPGKTLRQLLDQDEPFPALKIALEILQALEYTHSRGVVHGNLKPENILVSETIKLTDFGLRWIEQGRRLTESPLLMGGAEYLAPEQILGQPLEARTDLYAFGVIFYELLTGKRPFSAKDPADLLEQHLSQQPLPPRQINPKISRSLEHLILKLLVKEPERRYATATQVMRVLENTQYASSISAVSDDKDGETTNLRPRPRIIGRDTQINRLLNLWDIASRGQGQVVLIAGEAGIGKTRLAQEVAAQIHNAIVLTGQCSEAEGRSPYYPFIEAGRDYIARTPTTTLRLQLADSAAVVATLLPELYDLIPDLPPLAPLTTDHERLRLMHGLAQFIYRATASRPWFLLLDDLHWADTASLQVFHFLVRNVDTAPLFIVGTYRDNELDPEHPLNEMRRSLSRYPAYHHMQLDRLEQRGVGQLLSGFWGQEVPPDWVAAIYKRTGGNPFYAEEAAKDLVDQGTAALREGKWHFAPVIDVQLPKRAHDLILRRVSRLASSPQDLLRLAAVLGQQFTFENLQAVAGQSEEQLLENLDILLERGLIHEGENSNVLAFNHGEIQEVIYGDLNPLRKRVLHRRVASTLEKVYSDAIKSVSKDLAHHYAESGDNNKAFEYSLIAGKQARSLHAYQIALNWYERALTLMPEHTPSETTIELYEGLGHMRQAQALQMEALEAFTRMRDAAEAAGNAISQARAWSHISEIQDKQGDPQAALESARHAETLTRGAGEPGQVELARALYRKGWEHFRLGDLEEAYALGRQSLDLSRQLGPVARRETAMSLNLMGSVSRLRGHYSTAAEFQEQALSLYRELADREKEGVMLHNLAVNATHRGDYETAEKLFAEAIEIHREIGNRQSELITLTGMASAELGLEKYESAEKKLNDAIDLAVTANRGSLSNTFRYLAEAYLGQGRTEEAFRAAYQSLTLALQTGRQEFTGSAWFTLGNLAAHPDFTFPANDGTVTIDSLSLEELEEKLKSPTICFAESVRIFAEIGAESERARALKAWATYEMANGNRAQGQIRWKEALNIFQRLGMYLETERMIAENENDSPGKLT